MKRVISFFLSLVVILSAAGAAMSAQAANTNGYTDEAAEWFVKTALAEVGYKEGSGNKTKYGAWFGNNGVGWCAMFVAWCANQTDSTNKSKVLNTAIPKVPGCTSNMNWFKNKGLYKARSSGYKPKRGDVIYFDWNPGTGLDHMGIVTGTSVSGGATYVNTIEGNTSDMVNTRKYKLSSTSIVGYGIFDSTRVDYSGCKPNASNVAQKEEENIPQNIPVELVRLSGTNRFATANAISSASWGSGAANVVLTTSTSFNEALAAAPLTKLYNAPVLLTGGQALEDSVKAQLEKLSPTRVFIIGGTDSVSASIEDFIKQSSEVVRISGEGHYETAAAVGQYLADLYPTIKTAALVTVDEYADALSFGPVAAINRYPVLYTDGQTLNSATKEFILENGIEKIIVVGGGLAVSEDVTIELNALGVLTERVSGKNRYDTSVAIYNKYLDIFGDNVTIATGLNYPDALAGGSFAAKQAAPILLTRADAVPASVAAAIKANTSAKRLFLLGGKLVVPENTIRKIYA